MTLKRKYILLLLSVLLLTGCTSTPTQMAPTITPSNPPTITPFASPTSIPSASLTIAPSALPILSNRPTPNIGLSSCEKDVPAPKLSAFNPSADVYLSGIVDFCDDSKMASFDFDHGILGNIDENPGVDILLTLGGSQKIDVVFLGYLNQVNGAYVAQTYDSNPTSPDECKKLVAAPVHTTFVSLMGGAGAVGCILTNEGRLAVLHVEKTDTSTQSIEVSFIVWKIAASAIPPEMPTPTASPIPSKIPTSAFAPSDLLKNQCLEISPNLPAKVETQGMIVLDGNASFLYDPNTGKQKTFGHDRVYDLTVSPDHQWVAYTFYDSHETLWLTAETTTGKRIKPVLWNEDWYELGGWLNRQNLWITNYVGNNLDVMRFNPFTGEHQQLEGNFPGMKGIPSNYYNPLGHSRIIYNESQSLAIYPIIEKEDEYSLVLWDMKARRVVAKIKHTFEGPSRRPVWSPDGTTVYVIESLADGRGGDNIFSLSQDGQVHQITYFGEKVDSADIYELSMSPDGKKIAFGLTLGPSFYPYESLSLSVLDLKTKHVTNYCVTNISLSSKVWSPDSRFLAVTQWYGYEGQSVKTVLVDTKQGWAATLAKNTTPEGWMLEDVAP